MPPRGRENKFHLKAQTFVFSLKGLNAMNRRHQAAFNTFTPSGLSYLSLWTGPFPV